MNMESDFEVTLSFFEDEHKDLLFIRNCQLLHTHTHLYIHTCTF